MINQKGSSKTDTLIKLALVFFISLLSFSIGTFVGKKFSDNQNRLSALEGGHARQVAGIGNQDSKHDELTNDEFAKMAEEFVNDDVAPEKAESPTTVTKNEDHQEEVKTEEHSEQTDGHAEQAKKEEQVPAKRGEVSVAHNSKESTKETAKEHTKEAAKLPQHAATKVSEGKNPLEEIPAPPPAHKDTKATAVAPPPRLPSSLPAKVAQSPVGKYTVQVASYSAENEAQKMAADLKAKGFSSFYTSADAKGQTWYRVSVGLFSTQDEASKFKSKLMEETKISGAFIQKIVK